MEKYYQNEPNFNGVYSIKSLPEIKDLGQHELIGTDWIAFYGNGNNIIYFDSFAVEHILKEIKKIIGKKYHQKNS